MDEIRVGDSVRVLSVVRVRKRNGPWKYAWDVEDKWIREASQLVKIRCYARGESEKGRFGSPCCCVDVGMDRKMEARTKRIETEVEER